MRFLKADNGRFCQSVDANNGVFDPLKIGRLVNLLGENEHMYLSWQG